MAIYLSDYSHAFKLYLKIIQTLFITLDNRNRSKTYLSIHLHFIHYVTYFLFQLSDCCIVADGDCPCNRYKPHIEPLTDCILAPPPPPKPVKKCKKPKRVECFCEEVDYPRYESICRHKRSNEPNESTSSSEEDSNSSMDSDEEIQVKESLVSDKNAITVEQIKNCKISNEYGIKNVTNDQSNYYINDKPYFRKYYEPKNVEYLDDGSKIMYDYLGHKYIEKNGRKKIIKPAFYLEEEIRISEVTATKPIASADTNSTKISIENPSMNSAVTIKTDNKDVDAMDDLSKNLGSILSLLVQDKHNDLADALGDVLMGMAELEDMKTTLEEDLKTKKKEIKNKIAVETKLPAPSDISIPVNNKRLTSSDGPNLPFDKMIPTPLNRLPLSNANKLVPPIDKSHFAVENKAPLLERWIMQKENHQAAPAPELQIMFENKRPQPSTFDQLPVKEVKVPDKLQTNIKENLLGKLPETGRASSADKLYTKLTETPKLIFPLNEKQDEKNKNFIPIQKQIGLPNKNINAKINNIKPIPLQVNENLKTPYVPPKVMDDAFHQTENNKAFADNIRQEAKLIDVPIKFSPFNEIISDERNKNIVSINKEANQPDSNSNVNDGQVISLQTNENQKMPYAPFNIIDNRFRTLKPTQNNFKQYYQPVQQYPLKHVLSNNIEELNI